MYNHIEACEFLRNASANANSMDYIGMQVFNLPGILSYYY